MTPLAPVLDDIDFDALVEIGRSMLPSLTRARDGSQIWDDYNYHDPGIMLVELLAFIADTQVYALGRNRVDERLAMAAMLGVRPQGAGPATGALYPLDPVIDAYTVEPSTRIVPIQAPAPRLETTHRVDIVPVALKRLVREAGGNLTDLTSVNFQSRAHFAPFGIPPAHDAQLRITLEGTLPGAAVRLSLGIEVENPQGEVSPLLGGIDAYYAGGRIECAADTSGGMQRSGTLLLDLPADPERDTGNPTLHEIVLRPRKPGLQMPNLMRIAPNALPVAQRATFYSDLYLGSGRAGQTIKIEPQALFGEDEALSGWTWRLTSTTALTIEVSEGGELEPWQQLASSVAGQSPGTETFGAQGPTDRVFAHTERTDGSRIEIRFGNGVNGANPPLDATIRVGLELSAGQGGRVDSRLEWLLDERRTRWENRQPITDGSDAQGVEETLAALRWRLGRERPLATSHQIAEAASALPGAFGIARAEVEEGWERSRRRPQVPATRTLVVSRDPGGSETAEWCEAIARSLRSRLAIGERLLVVAPVYRHFGIAVRAAARTGVIPEAVAQAIREELVDRLTPTGGRGLAWPLGRGVDATSVGGWVRRVPGVAAVETVTLRDEIGLLLSDGRLEIGRGELPFLDIAPADILVTAESRQ